MGLLVLSRRLRIVQRRYQMHRRDGRSAAVEGSIYVGGRRFMEIGAFSSPDAGADQSITPNLFSERSQLAITMHIEVLSGMA
jgi:hypothetical protein